MNNKLAEEDTITSQGVIIDKKFEPVSTFSQPTKLTS